MTRRVEATLLLVPFMALLLVGLRGTWLVSGFESPGMPPEMVAIGAHLKAIAWAQSVVGLLGLVSAIGVLKGARWGYVGLAWLLTGVSVGVGLAKSLAGSAMLPPWGLVAASAALAGFAWHRIYSRPGDA